MGDEKKLKTVIHVRVTAPVELAEKASQLVADALESVFELIERTDPRPIMGDDKNVKIYVTVR